MSAADDDRGERLRTGNDLATLLRATATAFVSCSVGDDPEVIYVYWKRDISLRDLKNTCFGKFRLVHRHSSNPRPKYRKVRFDVHSTKDEGEMYPDENGHDEYGKPL